MIRRRAGTKVAVYDDVARLAVGLAKSPFASGSTAAAVRRPVAPRHDIDARATAEAAIAAGRTATRSEPTARNVGVVCVLPPCPTCRCWSTGCAFIDFNRDGFLDLVVVHYVDFDLTHTPHPGQTNQCQWKGKPVMCGPRGLPPETLSFYQNDGHGKFNDVSDQVHISGPQNYYGFTALTGDFDNDGWPDIFVACDSTASLYYHNLRGKMFEEIGVRSGLAYNEDGREQAGMGAAAADFDGDGSGHFQNKLRRRHSHHVQEPGREQFRR